MTAAPAPGRFIGPADAEATLAGVYAAGRGTVDLAIMLALGLLGFPMRRYGVPLVPIPFN
ncbi:MAG: tripartite tricarboxylate transporter permease [Gemmatimonadota bacterium]|nr:tripartite tricarboxylate transporter permease [Gemmatimonadota bacterium]